MPNLFRLTTAATILLAVARAGNGQDSAPQPHPGLSQASGNGQPIGQVEMAKIDPERKISSGDQIVLEIVEDRKSGFSDIVTEAGDLNVPPLGPVKVSGKTTAEAAETIKALLEKDYYHLATVRVSIYASKPLGVG